MEAKEVYLFVLTVSLLFNGCKQKAERETRRTEASSLEAKKVLTTRVERIDTEETVYATGNLAAQDRAVLSAKVPGRLESIEADLGKQVKQGDLLARIEKQDYELRRRQSEAALAQARARLGLSLAGEEDRVEPEKTSIVKEAQAMLNEASKNRDRLKSLRADGVVPEADIETAEASYQVALNRYDEAMHEAKNRMATLKLRQAELELAVQQLNDTEIRAPFAGVVEQRQTSPGEFLNIGAPVLTLVRVDPIRLRLEISEMDAPRIEIGQLVHLSLEGSNRRHDGKISRVSPVISPENRMLVAEADVPNPNGILRPGSFLKAHIVVNDRAPGLFVPKASVLTFAGIQKIFLVRDGKAFETEVKLNRDQNGLVEVTGALKAGDEVVVSPGTLRNGQPIERILNES